MTKVSSGNTLGSLDLAVDDAKQRRERQFSWAPDADGSFSDTSSANSNGANSLTFDRTGGTTDSNIATGSLPVAPVEDPPTSSSDGTAVGTENPVIPGQLPNALNVQSPTTAAASSVVPATPTSQPLTYLLRVDGVTGDSRLKGYEGWFTVDEYTFGELSQFARLGAGGGAVAGKAQLDPLMVDLSGLPEGLVGLLRDAVTGKNIHSIELAGVKAAGEGPAIKVYDLTLRNVMVAGYAEDGGHDTAVAFNYRSGTETISAQKPDGTTDAGQSVSFGGSLASVSQDTLAAFAHSHEGFPQVTSTIGSATNTAATSIDAAAAQKLALIGQYAASSFAVAGDSHGGTLITDPPPNQQSLLTVPHV